MERNTGRIGGGERNGEINQCMAWHPWTTFNHRINGVQFLIAVLSYKNDDIEHNNIHIGLIYISIYIFLTIFVNILIFGVISSIIDNAVRFVRIVIVQEVVGTYDMLYSKY